MTAVAYSQHLAAQRALTPAEPSLAQSRDEFARMFGMPVAEDVEVLPADDGGEWLKTPDADERRVLVYVHGGGFFAGSAEVYRALASELGRAAGCVVRSVEYRLAPEHPYPAAVQDVDAALSAVLDGGLAPGGVAVSADSAGANLALGAMLRRRDAGATLPAVAHLMSPWVDLGLSGGSIDAKADADELLSRDALASLVPLYAAGCDPCAPGLSPLYADLRGLPPLVIQA
ncbi:MAG TPA: alpha/beta hydrolase fold domain-containing protein, partial [Solirubrobacteraceae bacterium]